MAFVVVAVSWIALGILPSWMMVQAFLCFCARSLTRFRDMSICTYDHPFEHLLAHQFIHRTFAESFDIMDLSLVAFRSM